MTIVVILVVLLYSLKFTVNSCPFLNQWKGEMTVERDYMIKFHESMWPDLISNSVPPTPLSYALPTAVRDPASD